MGRPRQLATALIVLAACGAAWGCSGVATRFDGGLDDGAPGDDSGSSGSGASSGGTSGSSGGTCHPSSCKRCVLGQASCTSAGTCQCCLGGTCVPD